MKTILLPNLSHTEPRPDESHTSGTTGYANHAVKPEVYLGLIVNYSLSAGLSVELVELHVILIK